MKFTRFFALLTLFALASSNAFALDQIIRPYQSIRSAGMGGVLITTGLYEENFFGNPARVTANPKWRFNLISVMAESSTATVGNIGQVIGGGGNTFTSLADTAGTNNHARLQLLLPSVFVPLPNINTSFALGLEANFQGDFDLRQSYQIDPQVVGDAGPIFEVGHTFLPDHQLAVGMNVHYLARVTTKPGFGLVNVIQGSSSSLQDIGGMGTNFDVDLGTTYILPWKPAGLELSAGAAMNNLLGGTYTPSSLLTFADNPGAISQPRALGFGFSARYAQWKSLKESVLALEMRDIGNNTNGGTFRMIHFGGETHWGLLAIRLGINQGYWAAGLGLDLKVFTLDLASYGEEMGLNAGDLEDRRIALQFAFQI